MRDYLIKSPDGRNLKVIEAGVETGKPIFTLHGTPMSRILYDPHVSDASKRGIRLISYDRPGYGVSSPQPGRKVASAVKDVELIADELGIDRFAVWGISGGGPHAIACAALVGERLVATAALASPAPYPSPGLDWIAGQGEDNVAEFTASLEGPEKLDAFLKSESDQLLNANTEDMAKVMDSILPPVDKAVLSGELGTFMAESTKEGIRLGYEGWKEDDIAFISDWGFDLSKISSPLLLWQGTDDKMVPYSHGKWLSEHIPGVEARLLSGEGHLTLYERKIPETHEWLLNHF